MGNVVTTRPIKNGLRAKNKFYSHNLIQPDENMEYDIQGIQVLTNLVHAEIPSTLVRFRLKTRTFRCV